MNNNIGKTDIILVSFNRLNFLKKTIEAINERTTSEFRLIIIDNHSEQDVIDYLKWAKLVGMVHEVVFLEENVGQAMSQNIGFGMVTSKYFVLTQNDLICPKLSPDWLSRLIHLMEENVEAGCISMRINRTRRVPISENSSLIRNYKTIPAVFRIHRTKDTLLLGPEPFGKNLHWESSSCAEAMRKIGKKFYMATKIYADHFSFSFENKGYEKEETEYHTYSGIEKNDQGLLQPYADNDTTGANIPIKINHIKDMEEHEKRLKYWGMDTGIQSKQETARKWKQRYELGQYVDQYCEEGEKSIDLGCGSEKCNEKQIGIDIYPYPCVDILHTTDDLWFFEDNSIKVITASHHLEHLPDVKRVLNEWDRVLKPGGVIAFIVPDGEKRSSTICEPSHKYAFTTAVLNRLMKKYLRYNLLRLGPVPNIAERKASIICVAQKPLDRTINKIQEIEADLSKKAKDEILKGLQGVDARAAEKAYIKEGIDEVNSSIISEEIIEITE